MDLTYDTYDFTPHLGWSASRYETFDKCKRMYYYTYYGRHATHVPPYKVRMLKDMTSVPLEIGNIVHDVMEAFLRRLQKDDTNIDEQRFFEYARTQTRHYFSRKTFREIYYRQAPSLDMDAVDSRVQTCLDNFIGSPVYHWLFMKAIRNRENWLIEPGGYGETRLDGMKAYCKMDFLFPVDKHIYILDWKTGRKDAYKHSGQLVGYAAAASASFHIPAHLIFPKIVYLYPAFEELEVSITEQDLKDFLTRVRHQTEDMLSYCEDRDSNVPKEIDSFPLSPSEPLCRNCNFQELCFPEGLDTAKARFG
ncbi:MAG: hypothetical protein GF418_15775 [Chitinivibrionales bacterium]|nr:hypothetical protein [Chitinivibrionales bacterium]